MSALFLSQPASPPTDFVFNYSSRQQKVLDNVRPICKRCYSRLQSRFLPGFYLVFKITVLTITAGRRDVDLLQTLVLVTWHLSLHASLHNDSAGMFISPPSPPPRVHLLRRSCFTYLFPSGLDEILPVQPSGLKRCFSQTERCLKNSLVGRTGYSSLLKWNLISVK